MKFRIFSVAQIKKMSLLCCLLHVWLCTAHSAAIFPNQFKGDFFEQMVAPTMSIVCSTIIKYCFTFVAFPRVTNTLDILNASQILKVRIQSDGVLGMSEYVLLHLNLHFFSELKQEGELSRHFIWRGTLVTTG